MPVESTADRAVFVNPDEFGAVAIYTAAGGAASLPFAGQFDDPSIAADMNDAPSIDARPTFLCRAIDLPLGASGDAGDSLQVAAEGTFEVVSIEPDGTGMVLLRLGAAS
jgi:hypothetical protein